MLMHIHQKISAIFSSRHPATVITLNVLILLLLGWFDVVTGDYSLIILYLIPVSLVAWFVSMRCGILFCILAISVRIAADEYSVPPDFSHAMLHYWNELMELFFLLIMAVLFSTLKKNLVTEKTLSTHDPLTGALNRRFFFDLAEHEINRSRRYSLPFTVAYIDLDNFKDVNDNLGHRTGDEVLVTVASTIRSNMRSSDILARLGGDEFVILLPETFGEAAMVFLTKMHNDLNETSAQNNWPVTFSIGSATYIEAPQAIDEVILRADELMYSVKRSGKSRLLHREFRGGANG
ncbi:MAG: diguanylate cyclase [Desulfuromonadaceae bacterium]|nr:diguanylate cyclase [Desulfuromonadaceae bacterium]